MDSFFGSPLVVNWGVVSVEYIAALSASGDRNGKATVAVRRAIFRRAERRDIDITRAREDLGTEARDIFRCGIGTAGRINAIFV